MAIEWIEGIGWIIHIHLIFLIIVKKHIWGICGLEQQIDMAVKGHSHTSEQKDNLKNDDEIVAMLYTPYSETWRFLVGTVTRGNHSLYLLAGMAKDRHQQGLESWREWS